MIPRRTFLATTGAAILVGRLAAEAQQAGSVTVGILANHAWPPIDSFRQGLGTREVRFSTLSGSRAAESVAHGA